MVSKNSKHLMNRKVIFSFPAPKYLAFLLRWKEEPRFYCLTTSQAEDVLKITFFHVAPSLACSTVFFERVGCACQLPFFHSFSFLYILWAKLQTCETRQVARAGNFASKQRVNGPLPKRKIFKKYGLWATFAILYCVCFH